jgi:hypothetical protein
LRIPDQLGNKQQNKGHILLSLTKPSLKPKITLKLLLLETTATSFHTRGARIDARITERMFPGINIKPGI